MTTRIPAGALDHFASLAVNNVNLHCIDIHLVTGDIHLVTGVETLHIPD